MAVATGWGAGALNCCHAYQPPPATAATTSAPSTAGTKLDLPATGAFFAATGALGATGLLTGFKLAAAVGAAGADAAGALGTGAPAAKTVRVVATGAGALATGAVAGMGVAGATG